VALWSLEGIKHYDQSLIESLLNTQLDNLRREAVRSLQSFSLSTEELASLLTKPSMDSNPMVRSQVLRTLEAVNKSNSETIGLLVAACNPPLEGNAMGGAYERNFERYLARKALENYPKELLAFIQSPKANDYESSNLIWASQALPKKEREQTFVDLWKKMDNKDLDESTFKIVAGMLDNRNVLNSVRPILEDNNKAVEHVSLTLKNLGSVQSKELTSTLKGPIKSLLKSGDLSKQMLGLEAVGKLNVDGLRNDVLPLIKNTSSPEMINLVMSALKKSPSENKATFIQIAKMDELDIELRASAVQTVAIADVNSARNIMENWLPNLDVAQKKTVVKIIASSKEGGTLLKELLDKELISANEFDYSSAEKVYQSDTEDKRGVDLFEQVKKRTEEEKKGLESRLERFMAIAEKGEGNPENGEKLFQTCLLCHSVGDKGYDYAPALDGSALRENEALLTAILDPDAALESSYAIYRVTKNDGSNIEGYLIKKDERGTTIGFMGGTKQFVQASEIRFEGFLGGRSFMPKGLIDNYSDEQVSDLLAFIKTLK
ncbi:MAG: c-type cytochrome, partial [Arenibacter sp.]|nr:c-type cytochrome [Arenibacter sp.]